MIGPRAALIWCPFPNEESAASAARSLLEAELVACANIMPAMRSLYRWKGDLGDSLEAGVLFKTNDRLLDDAMARLQALHPYETPAILGWHCDAASPDTLGWLAGL